MCDNYNDSNTYTHIISISNNTYTHSYTLLHNHNQKLIEFANANDDISILKAIDNINPEMMQLAMVELQLWLIDNDGIVWSRRRDDVHVRLGDQSLSNVFKLPQECNDNLCVHTQYGYVLM